MESTQAMLRDAVIKTNFMGPALVVFRQVVRQWVYVEAREPALAGVSI